jgi:hypothetical protein
MNGTPRMRTPSRRSGARSWRSFIHAPGGRAGGGDGCARSAGGRAAVCGAPAGRVPVLGRFRHRRTPCLCAGFGGPASRYCGWSCQRVVRCRCVTVFACVSSSSSARRREHQRTLQPRGSDPALGHQLEQRRPAAQYAGGDRRRWPRCAAMARARVPVTPMNPAPVSAAARVYVTLATILGKEVPGAIIRIRVRQQGAKCRAHRTACLTTLAAAVESGAWARRPHGTPGLAATRRAPPRAAPPRSAPSGLASSSLLRA